MDNFPWYEWQHLQGKRINAIDRERAIVLVTCSPIEVHGPHLPTVTDICEAEGLARRTAEILHERAPGRIFLHLPPIYVAADVLPHVGSLMFRSSTITAVIEDLGRSLVRQGFRDIWINSFHGGPRHFVPIEVACDRVNRRFDGRMVSVFSLLLNRLTGGSTDLTGVLGHVNGVHASDLVGDAHGGVVETSMMLHLLGQHVDPCWRELDHRTLDLKLAAAGKATVNDKVRPTLPQLMRGFKEKIKYYEDETWSGKPAVAAEALGAEFLDILSGHCADALAELLDGRRSPEECYSPLWKARWLFTSRTVGWAFEKAVRYRQRVW